MYKLLKHNKQIKASVPCCSRADTINFNMQNNEISLKCPLSLLKTLFLPIEDRYMSFLRKMDITVISIHEFFNLKLTS